MAVHRGAMLCMDIVHSRLVRSGFKVTEINERLIDHW